MFAVGFWGLVWVLFCFSLLENYMKSAAIFVKKEGAPNNFLKCGFPQDVFFLPCNPREVFS